MAKPKCNLHPPGEYNGTCLRCPWCCEPHMDKAVSNVRSTGKRRMAAPAPSPATPQPTPAPSSQGKTLTPPGWGGDIGECGFHGGELLSLSGRDYMVVYCTATSRMALIDLRDGRICPDSAMSFKLFTFKAGRLVIQ